MDSRQGMPCNNRLDKGSGLALVAQQFGRRCNRQTPVRSNVNEKTAANSIPRRELPCSPHDKIVCSGLCRVTLIGMQHLAACLRTASRMRNHPDSDCRCNPWIALEFAPNVNGRCLPPCGLTCYTECNYDILTHLACEGDHRCGGDLDCWLLRFGVWRRSYLRGARISRS